VNLVPKIVIALVVAVPVLVARVTTHHATPLPKTALAIPAQTGTHWANLSDYRRLKSIGYGFSITNVAPGHVGAAKAKLNAAEAAGIKLIIGLYAFLGPQPYTLNPEGTWTFTQGSIDVIRYLKSRSRDILAFFGMNEPYWVDQATGDTNPCGVLSAANLRQFRTQLQQMWPGVKVYQDIGWPSEWAPGGDLSDAYSCIGDKYADQTGVADYVGIWDYPFTTSGYRKTTALARLTKESNFVVNSMDATPVWLAQSFAGVDDQVFPSTGELVDWNCAIRRTAPAGALISWYVWREPGLYSDTLAAHPEDWPSTTARACR
jgi:hypothetical protein